MPWATDPAESVTFFRTNVSGRVPASRHPVIVTGAVSLPTGVPALYASSAVDDPAANLRARPAAEVSAFIGKILLGALTCRNRANVRLAATQTVRPGLRCARRAPSGRTGSGR